MNNSIKGLKIGLPKQYFDKNLDSNVAELIEDSIKELEKLGGKCIDIELPHTELSIPAYYVVAPAECSSNLSRFDGVRFGHRCNEPKNLSDLYCRSRQEGFGKEVKRRIMTGTYDLSSGYYDAYYLKAQKVRQIIRNDFQNAFKNVDIILGPTTTGTAFKLNEKLNDPIISEEHIIAFDWSSNNELEEIILDLRRVGFPNSNFFPVFFAGFRCTFIF